MAREEYRYNPLDFEPDIAIGVTYPLNGGMAGRSSTSHYASGSASGNQGVFGLSYTTEEQAISNLKNLILTVKGERYMQPDFGCRLAWALFEPNSEQLEREIKDSLNEDIKFWLPYIIMDEIIVNRIPDYYILDITLNFRVTEQGANHEIKVAMSPSGVELNNNIL